MPPESRSRDEAGGFGKDMSGRYVTTPLTAAPFGAAARTHQVFAPHHEREVVAWRSARRPLVQLPAPQALKAATFALKVSIITERVSCTPLASATS